MTLGWKSSLLDISSDIPFLNDVDFGINYFTTFLIVSALLILLSSCVIVNISSDDLLISAYIESSRVGSNKPLLLLSLSSCWLYYFSSTINVLSTRASTSSRACLNSFCTYFLLFSIPSTKVFWIYICMLTTRVFSLPRDSLSLVRLSCILA